MHLRQPQPIYFPEEAEVPESKEHLVVRTFLFQLLRFALGPGHTVGSDQFVYWNARDPKRCLAPDVFVCVDMPDSLFRTWQTWDRGRSPDLAVEIVSIHEGDGVQWEEKLVRYHELGVKELVRFDPNKPTGTQLRVWDRLADDLVERRVEGDTTPCLTLRSRWVVRSVEDVPAALRLVDSRGELVLDAREAAVKRAETEELAKRVAEGRALAAEARVCELEAALARKG